MSDGRLTSEQGLVYRVFAEFADPRLPAEFRGAQSPNVDSTVIAQALRFVVAAVVDGDEDRTHQAILAVTHGPGRDAGDAGRPVAPRDPVSDRLGGRSGSGKGER